MKKFWTDRVALSFAAAGIILMAFTLAWRINPVEGSVVPDYLFNNPVGVAVFWVLFVTCMPAYIAGLTLSVVFFGENNPSAPLHWVPHWFPAFPVMVLFVQIIAYFLFGKLVSVCLRRGWRRNKATAP
jgi:hypothetical protein